MYLQLLEKNFNCLLVFQIQREINASERIVLQRMSEGFRATVLHKVKSSMNEFQQQNLKKTKKNMTSLFITIIIKNIKIEVHHYDIRLFIS